MKKSYLIVACLAMALPTLSISMDADAAGKAQRGFRGQLVHRIVMKWGNHIQEAYRMDVREWARDMAPIFAKADMETLQRAADARKFDEMNDAFLGNRQRISITQNALVNDSGAITSRKFGDIAGDLVFVPITPCRIIDTRLAGGQIAAGTTRAFDVTAVADYSFQGGDPSNCGGAGAAGSFAAAAINFTVVFPVGGPGHITVYPFLAPLPTASSLNFNSGDVRGNSGVFRLDQGASANELNVFVTHTTHLVGDLVGYFIAPEATALECVEKLSAGNTIAAGSFGTQSTASCDAGYTITGGGCSMSNFDGRVVTSRSIVSVSSQTHFCAFRNEGSGTVDGLAYSRCCRTPGRP